MKRVFLATLALLIFSSLCACTKRTENSPVIEPDAAVAYSDDSSNTPASLTPSQRPSVLPPDPTATLEPVSYGKGDFFPTEDFLLTYVTKDGGQEESFVEYRRDRSDGEYVQRRSIFTREGSAAPYVDVYSMKKDGIYLSYERKNVGYCYDFTGRAQNNSSQELILPDKIEEGAHWDVEGGQSTITSIDKLVKLPVGELRTVEVTTQYEDGLSRRILFYSGVGIVACYEMDAQGNITESTELLDYEGGRNNKQRMYLYFADRAEPAVIKYVWLDISYTTNQSMENVFRDALQRRLGDTLVSLGKDVSIRKISLDQGSVRVDFSSEMSQMVRDAELWPELEVSLLRALANTFGSYYQVEKVYLDIDGVPYSSRSVQLLDDEYIETNYDRVQRYEQ